MLDKKLDPLLYDGLTEVALRLDLPPNKRAKIPTHVFFADDSGQIIKIKCESCSCEYAIGQSRLYPSHRPFDDLRSQLKEALQQEHSMSRSDHPTYILLKGLYSPKPNQGQQES